MADKMPDQTPSGEGSQGYTASEPKSQQEFMQTIMGCERTLYRVSRTVLHRDEDCVSAVQEALGKAWLQFDPSGEPSEYRIALIRILLDVCSRRLKRRKSTAAAPDPEKQHSFGLVSEGVLSLQKALEALPTDLRIIAELHSVEELKTKEIARILRLPVGAVKRRLARAQSQLAACLPPGESFADLDETFKETFPPTPMQFSQTIALPLSAPKESQGRHHVPIFAVAAVALSVILLLAAVANFSPESFTNLLKTPTPSAFMAPSVTATPDANLDNTVALIETGVYPTPPPVTPLPTLPVQELNKAPASADGWQAAAYTDAATWYYNPANGKLARTAAGKSQAYTIFLGKGQSIDTYSFTTPKDGRWLAFTVHTETGDDVWLVMDDGRKMSLISDIRWVDEYTFQPISFNFANMKAVTLCNNEMSQDEINSQTDNSPIWSVILCLTAPSGEVYYALISPNTRDQYAAYGLNDRRGMLVQYTTLKQGETTVSWTVGKSSSFNILHSVGNNTFNIGYDNERSKSITLKSNRFSLFKALSGSNIGIDNNIKSLLVIYQDDPTHTLWEVNGETGKAQKIVEGCLAAGWLDEGQYWYSVQTDAAVVSILKHSIPKFSEVTITGDISLNSSTNNDVTTISLGPAVYVTNNTKDKLVLDEKTTYDFKVTKDGKTILHKTDALTAQDVRDTFVYNSSASTDDSTPSLPLIIPSGYVAHISFSETIDYGGKGTYTFSGTFKGIAFSCQKVIGQSRSPLQPGLSIAAVITAGGRLGLTYSNTSYQSYRLQVYNTQDIASALYQPYMNYQLLSGDKVVKKGFITFNKINSVLVPAGGTLALLESSGDPQFASLPAGQYRLQAAFLQDENDSSEFSELSGGETIDVSLTIPGK